MGLNRLVYIGRFEAPCRLFEVSTLVPPLQHFQKHFNVVNDRIIFKGAYLKGNVLNKSF